jgi:amidase/nitrilase
MESLIHKNRRVLVQETRKIVGAVAQVAQHFFDTKKNLAIAIDFIHKAARSGADIIVFSECYLGQYPYWAQYFDKSGPEFAKIWTELFSGAVKIGGEEFIALSEAARSAKIHVVMGCNELSDEPGSSTLYNTMLFFDRNGELIGRHRKLMPTHHERLIHGRGDGRDLRVHSTDIGMLGGLICYEHHMTLSKYAMAAMGEEIHAASWPGMWRSGDPELGERVIEADLGMPFSCNAEAAIREYAAETGNFVLSASGYTPKENISKEWRDLITNLQADWAVGGSAIVAPGGEYLVSPVINEEKLLIAELDMNRRRLWKAFFDPMGHYSRPDVYNLQIVDIEGRERSYVSNRFQVGTTEEPKMHRTLASKDQPDIAVNDNQAQVAPLRSSKS